MLIPSCVVCCMFIRTCATCSYLHVSSASGQLSEWCEELGQSLLLRHPKNRPPDASKGPPPPPVLNNMHPQMHKAVQPMHP
ncbi:hypothetical protein Btru_073385 [Bulinus truncatus]|nr:hypothetical protein Btru_073385 [Bulinus truncatus]